MSFLLRLFYRVPPPPLQDKGETMKAAVLMCHGDSSSLVYGDFPRPSPAPGSQQVLVQVCASSVNPVDFKLRQHPIFDALYPKPRVVGNDFSGVVVGTGERVFGMLPFFGSRYGAYAEFVCPDEECWYPAPPNVPLQDLASLPLVGSTVVQALRPVVAAWGGECRGKKCFVVQGSGGVGTFAVQYCARVLGMHVSTTCSPRNFQLMLSLGASIVIDYHGQDLDALKGYDVFLDTMPYRNSRKVLSSATILNYSGAWPRHYIHIASSPYGDGASSSSAQCAAADADAKAADPLHLMTPECRLERLLLGHLRALLSRWSPLSRARYHFVVVRPERASLAEIASVVSRGLVQAQVQQVLPLRSAGSAQDLVERGHATARWCCW